MARRRLFSMARGAMVAGLVCLTAGVAQAQGERAAAEDGGWTAPRTAWGVPDLQGIWDYRTMTPLERPREFADRAVFSPSEAASFEARTLEEQADYDRSPSVHAKWWLDYGQELTGDRRTSLVVDPPNGRIPPLTEEAAARNAERSAYRRGHPSDGAESRGVSERCLSFGTPRLPGAYNNNYQILQTADHVAIVSEMIHDVRIIPIDERLPSAPIPQWHGEARGHYEGDTLIVESSGYVALGAFRGATDRLRLTERFTQVVPGVIHYEITADDPDTWTDQWTVMYPMVKTDQPLYEYACHEGNYGLQNILRNARLEDAALLP
jgi:hypothetical protein